VLPVPAGEKAYGRYERLFSDLLTAQIELLILSLHTQLFYPCHIFYEVAFFLQFIQGKSLIFCFFFLGALFFEVSYFVLFWTLNLI